MYHSCTVGNPNTEQSATPWVEVALITLSASEKATGYENTMINANVVPKLISSDKPVAYVSYPVCDCCLAC